jgi:peptide deformylase
MDATVREIVQAGDPVLRRAARLLTVEELRGEEVRRLIADMRETMRAAPGVGLAAPQIGVSLALVVIEDRPEYVARLDEAERAERERAPVDFHVLANPRLAITDAQPAEFFEGCLSVAGFVALVPRASAVRVEALDEEGRPLVIEARGWYARILQHEIDHLAGTLCVDRMEPRSLATTDNYAHHWDGLPTAEVRARLGLGPR